MKIGIEKLHFERRRLQLTEDAAWSSQKILAFVAPIILAAEVKTLGYEGSEALRTHLRGSAFSRMEGSNSVGYSFPHASDDFTSSSSRLSIIVRKGCTNTTTDT